MKVYLKSINVWLQGEDDPTQLTLWANNKLKLADDFLPPKPQYYPKAQLRRLSPFSKVALYCLDMPLVLTSDYPLIFASQHGDLAKTVNLIKDATLGEDLSPTQFALSVHNATTGLFSIATGNTAPTTTISAGENTFIEGLIEAAMQCQQENTPVIYTYCDFDVPEEYRQFSTAKPARCISILIANEQTDEIENASVTTLELTPNDTEVERLNVHSTKDKDAINFELLTPSITSDLSLCFIRHYYLKSNTPLYSGNYSLALGFK